MTHHTLLSPDPATLRRQVAVFPALKKRRQHQSNIWFFDSPKNNQRLTITTDLAFMHFVIAEGDPSILRYVPNAREQVGDSEGRDSQYAVGAQVYRRDGSWEWWHFKRVAGTGKRRQEPAREQRGASREEQAAADAGATYRVKTDLELAHQELLFDNWLTLCAAITRCRGQFLGREADLFSQQMSVQQAATLQSLIELPGIDVACMLAVVATALHEGNAHTNLTTQLFGRSSLLLARAP